MPNTLTLAETKIEIKRLIRNHSDRGFLPYQGCNHVCHAMLTIVEDSKTLEDRKESFDIHLFILIEVVKLISHADTSSGSVNDVIDYCLEGIEEYSKSAPDDDRKILFNAIIKSAKNKAFKDWAEYGYRLLRNAVYLVQEHKQAEIVYGLFPILGTMYGGKEYPDRYVITQGIIERLEGAAAAEQYQMQHIHIPEIRTMVVERAMSSQQYALAEKLCLEGLQNDKSYGQVSAWAYYLERIYTELANAEKQIEMVHLILIKGDRSYYGKLKDLYKAAGVWEQRRESILQELSKAYMSYKYADLLSEEGELARLLSVVQADPVYIEQYGKQLAREFPAETYLIYETYITSEAAAAADRKKYKRVCKLIKGYFDTGAKPEARELIQRLMEKYPRRAAMVDELEALAKKLTK